MNKWLDTLSSMRLVDVDVEGVDDQDDWVERLHTVGQKAYVTSGTTGVETFGRPDASYFLTEEPMRIAEITRMGARRKRIAEGSALEGGDDKFTCAGTIDSYVGGVME